MAPRPGSESGVYFLRHAPTAYNIDGRFMGTLDLPILPIGPDAMASEPFLFGCPKVGYTSPMRRARQTIDALFPDVEEHVDTRLRERALGEWEGLSKHEVRDEWPAAFLDSGPLDPRFTPPGGEELVSLQGRIRAFLVDLCELGPESALVMTHNGCIRTVKATLGKIRLDEFFVESEEPGHPYFVSWSELHDARGRGVI